jgi:hypothetical protein
MPAKLTTTTRTLSGMERRARLKTNALTANVEQIKPTFSVGEIEINNNSLTTPAYSFDAGKKFDVDIKPLGPTVLPKINPKKVSTPNTIDKRVPVEDQKPTAPELVQKVPRSYSVMLDLGKKFEVESKPILPYLQRKEG